MRAVSIPKGKKYANGTKFFIHKAKLVYITKVKRGNKIVERVQTLFPPMEYEVANSKKRQLRNHRNYSIGRLEVVSLLKKGKQIKI